MKDGEKRSENRNSQSYRTLPPPPTASRAKPISQLSKQGVSSNPLYSALGYDIRKVNESSRYRVDQNGSLQASQKRGQRSQSETFPTRPAAALGATRPYSQYDPTNKPWTWEAIVDPRSESHQEGAEKLTMVLSDFLASSKRFNTATKMEVSRTVYSL